MDSVVDERRDRRIVFSAVICGAVLRALLLAYWEGAPSDGIGRTMYAQQWLEGNRALFGATTWPELNYLLPALAIKLGGDLYWSPRVLFALLSLLTIPLAFDVAKRLHSIDAGRIAAWSAALLPSLAVFATSGARSELIAAIGMLLAAVGIMRWQFGAGSYSNLLLAATGVAIAEGMRFDGVLVGATLGFVLLLECIFRPAGVRRSRRILGMTAFGALCLIYPVALAVKWQLAFGDPLHFLHTAQLNSRQFLESGGHARWPTWLYRTYAVAFLPLAIGYIVTPVVFLLSLFGGWFSRRTEGAATVWAMVVVQSLFLTKNVLDFTQQPQIRYAVPMSVLLLPFFGIGLDVILNRARDKSVKWLRRGVVWTTVALSVIFVELISGVATLVPLGVLSRQLGGTNLVQVNQFASRELIQTAAKSAATGDSLLIETFAAGPYSALAGSIRRGQLGIGSTSVYRDQTLVYSYAEYSELLNARLAHMRFVIAASPDITDGFRDGLQSDPLTMTSKSSVGDSISWREHRFRIARRSGSLLLLERVR